MAAAACTAFCAPPSTDELEKITGLPEEGKTAENAPGEISDLDRPGLPATSDVKDADDLPSIKAPVTDGKIAPPPPAATDKKSAPTTKPADKKAAAKPVAPVKPTPINPVLSTAPAKEAPAAKKPAPKKPAAPTAPKKVETPAPPAAPQTPEEKLQNLILKLQMENAQLMQSISKGRQANASLTDALRESRMHASDLEAELRSKEIEITIKNEKAVLEKLKAVASTQPAKTAQVLQQENNILALQLKMSRIDEPQRTKEMLETIGNITRERDTLDDKNKRLHTMLNEQIKKNEQSTEELNVIRKNFQDSEKEIARLRLEVKAYKEAMANPTAAAPKVEYVSRPVATSPAAASTASTDSAGGAAPRTPVKIEINRIAGKITSIDDQIIKINVGSLQGLQAGMRLIVYRRDKFIGYLRVDIVGETTAAGAMSRQVLMPQIGDNVVDRL